MELHERPREASPEDAAAALAEYRARDHYDENAHPVTFDNMTADEKFALIAALLAAHHDQIWWMNLPPAVRQGFMDEGFEPPVKRFYGVSF